MLQKTLSFFFILVLLSCNKTTTPVQEPSTVTKDTLSTTTSEMLSSQENTLTDIHKAMDRALGNLRNDSLLQQVSTKFTQALTTFVSQNPATLQYDFPQLTKNGFLKIVTSSDQQVRFYSWDTALGGSMRFYEQLAQWKTKSKTYTSSHFAAQENNNATDGADPKGFYSAIYSLKDTEKKALYLVISNSIYSSNDNAQTITAFQIQNEKLVEVPVFKTKNQQLSSITINYNFSSVVDRPERPVKLIVVKNNIVTIPVVDEQGNVSNNNLKYIWTGSTFEYKTTE